MDMQTILQNTLEQVVNGKIILAILLGFTLIFGVLWCFFGTRYFKIITITNGICFGLILGSVIGHMVGLSITETQELSSISASFEFSIAALIGAVLGALVAGVLSIPFFYIIVFLMGASVGAGTCFLVLSVLGMPIDEPLLVMILGGLVVGIFLVWVAIRALVFFTSFFGAALMSMASLSLWTLTDAYGAGADVDNLMSTLQWMLPIVFVVFILGGIVVQTLTNKKRLKQTMPPLKVPPTIPPQSLSGK